MPQPDEPTTPPPTTHQTQQPEQRLGVVEGFRLCHKCGFQLAGSIITKEPRYDLVIIRCPECGHVHPASDPVVVVRTRGSSRLAGAAAVLLLKLFALFIIVTLVAVGIIWLVEDEPTAQEQSRLAWYLLLGPLVAVLMPHLRWWSTAAVASTIALLGVPYYLTVSSNSYRLDFLAVAVVASPILGAAAISGLFGRPVARAMVLLLLPPELRAPMADLWFASGLTPPGRRKRTTPT